MEANAVDRLLPLKEVLSLTDLPRSTLYELMWDGDFPRPVHTSAKRRAWPESEVAAWVEKRKRARS